MSISEVVASQRDGHIDVFRGLCMILVVLGHAVGMRTDPINHYILSFHMPIFFFISGLCVHYSNPNKPVWESIKHKLSTIGYQYIVFSIIGLLLYWIIFKKIGKSEDYTFAESILTVFNGHNVTVGFWFVYDLFIITILYILLSKVKIRAELFLILSLALFVFFSYHQDSWFCTRATYRIPGGAIFYSLGDLLGRYHFKTGKTFIKKYRVAYMILSVMMLVLLGHLAFINTPVLMATNDYGRIELFISTGLLASLAFLVISTLIKNNATLEYIGRNSILFLFVHFYCLDVSHMIYNVMFGSGMNNTFPIYFIHFAVALSLSFAFAYMVNRYAPWLKSYKR